MLELSPFENHVSACVLELQASAAARRCVEGCSGLTSCAQCRIARIEEHVAVDRVKKLFGAAYANVQMHSASQAVSIVYKALLADRGAVLALSQVDAGDRWFKTVPHGWKVHNEEIDYDKLRALARTHKPCIISARYSEACRVLDFSALRAIADQVGAYLYIDIAHVAGLIAAGLYPNPVAIADVVTTATDGTLRGPPGGVILARSNPEIEEKIGATVSTEVGRDPAKILIAAKAQAFKEALDANFISYQCQVIANARAMLEVFLARGYKTIGNGGHDASFVVDLSEKGIAGEAIAGLLKKIHIHVGDSRGPFMTCGIRLGASAIATRGFKVPEAKSVASLMCDMLDHGADRAMVVRTRKEIDRLCVRFPVYP